MADIAFATTVPLGTRLNFNYTGAQQTSLTVTYSYSGTVPVTIANAVLIKTNGQATSNDAYLFFNIPGAWTVNISGVSRGAGNILELLLTAPPFFGSVIDWNNESQNYVGTFNVDATLL